MKYCKPWARLPFQRAKPEVAHSPFTIADTGFGMTKDEITEALAPFNCGETALTRKVEGAGLGLPLISGLVTVHGGTLDIVSAPETGTTVTARLPSERIVE